MPVFVVLLFLFVQFLTGMWVNLYTVFPSYPLNQGFGFMGEMMTLMHDGGFLLMGHMMFGFLIEALSVVVLVASFIWGRLGVALMSVLGFASVSLAGLGGLLFMFSGFASSFDSYIMALGFVLAFTFYSAMLYLSK
ncbi:MAG: hypothetical protein QW767_03980 [Thermoprotei archaeon]